MKQRSQIPIYFIISHLPQNNHNLRLCQSSRLLPVVHLCVFASTGLGLASRNIGAVVRLLTTPLLAAVTSILALGVVFYAELLPFTFLVLKYPPGEFLAAADRAFLKLFLPWSALPLPVFPSSL